MKSRKKPIIITLIIVALIALAYVIIGKIRNESRSVEVVPVAMIASDGFDNATSMGGFVSDAASQSVNIEQNQVIEEVHVKKGQHVKKGDKLITFNTNSINISLEIKKIGIDNIRLKMEKAERALGSYKNMTPREDIPAPPPVPIPEPTPNISEFEHKQVNGLWKNIDLVAEDEDIDFLKTLSPGQGGIQNPYLKGSIANPYHYAVTGDAFVSGKFIKEFSRIAKAAGSRLYVSFDFYKGDSKEAGYESSVVLSDEILSNLLADYDNDLLKLKIAGREIIMNEPEQVPEVPDPREGALTRDEIRRAIIEKENELKNLDISVRREEIKLKEMQDQLEGGVLYAKRDGIVSEVKDPNDFKNDGKPFMTIVGGKGIEVRGTISELHLDKFGVGTKLDVINFETGKSYEAKVTSVNDYPTNDRFFGSGSANASNYGFTAYIDSEDSLNIGSYLDIKLARTDQEAEKLYIQNPYIRSENGKKYVMKEVNGRLVKQFIETGKVLYNMATEVISGITREDFVAFPYGNGAIEGIKTKSQSEAGGEEIIK